MKYKMNIHEPGFHALVTIALVEEIFTRNEIIDYVNSFEENEDAEWWLRQSQCTNGL